MRTPFVCIYHGGDNTSDANYEGKKRKGRGLTRGLKVDKIVQYVGRIPIRFTPEQKEPVCENANNFSIEMGILVRQFAPLQVIDWSHMPEVEKSTLFYRLLAKFDVHLSLPHVYQYVNTTMGKFYSNNRCKMHKHFKSFQKVEDAILKHYTNVSKNDWLLLCEHFCSDKFHIISKRNSKSRDTLKIKHRGGSKTIHRHVEEMKIGVLEEVTTPCWVPWDIREDEKDVCSVMVDVTKKIEERDLNTEMEEMQKLEGELTHNETPLIDVEIIERVLGPRSAYIKGFRKVHKTLMSSIPSSSTQQAEMIALKAELESTQEELKIAREKSLNTEERVKRLEELCLGNKDSLIMHLLS
ncbi:hypothetical protein Ddye_029430 [Dipteronia dyeriana]|uniref:Transposase n=1 Tax=Dipteronia dyeriana TaxID=168575 RepID=A0AAD9WLT2_9ROSI|nr:hypothetical protein Ddye_029430 [Dipteronia dyeriana]